MFRYFASLIPSLLCLSFVQSVFAQQPDTVVVRVGSPHLDGRLLKPYRQRFLGFWQPCVYSGDSTERFVEETEQLEFVRSAADTLLLQTTTSVYADGRRVVDSTIYDHRTLSARQARYRLRSFPRGTGFDIQGAHVMWFDSVNTPTVRLDTTFAESGYLEGSAELLIQSVPLLYRGGGVVIKWPVVGVGGDAPDALGLYQAWQEVKVSPGARPPRGVPAGSIAVEVGPSVFWMDPRSRRIVAKQFQPFEGTCESIFLLQGP